MQLLRIIGILSLISLTGCGNTIYVDEDASILDGNTSHELAKSKYTETELEIYRSAVEDVLSDVKGKMYSGRRYIVRKPITDCGVTIPSRIISGVMYPEHKGCIEFAPGDIKQMRDIQMPVIGDE